MKFRLALALGMTVKRLDKEMDSPEFSEWIAYLKLDPLPDPWRMHGEQCVLLHNAWYQGSRTAEDWMPHQSAVHRQSSKEIGAALETFAKRHNARVEHEKRKGQSANLHVAGGPQ